MSKLLAFLALALLVPVGSLGGQSPATLRTVSVLQFLIDTDGTGLFDPPASYCISDARLDESAGAEVLRRLDGGSASIVPGDRCGRNDEGTEVMVLEDRSPAILLWARPGTEAEARRSRASIEGAPWAREAGLMRAGFTSAGMAVEYACWVRNEAAFDVLHCDARIVT